MFYSLNAIESAEVGAMATKERFRPEGSPKAISDARAIAPTSAT